MSNRTTDEAVHNAKDMRMLLAAFRADRGRLVARIESLSEDDWGRSALHPRIKHRCASWTSSTSTRRTTTIILEESANSFGALKRTYQ